MIFENRGTILIVDQDHSILENISQLLRESGYDPFDSSNSRDAIAQLKNGSFDAVIADIRMPDLSGLEFIDKIRDFNSYIPVILMTAFADLYKAIDEIKLKAFDFIVMPCEHKQILHSVSKAVHYHRLIKLEKNYNAKLEDLVNEKTRELVTTLDSLKTNSRKMMKRIVSITEFRDVDTKSHIKRIGLYSEKLSDALNMPDEFTKTIKFASALHDVGKVVIPDSVLLKPGDLTQKEFEIIMKHTTIGAKMLSGFAYPGIQMAASIALTHHERWDGTGYPKKLHGEKIPIEGRIVFLADRYDAIRSKRPYKPPVEHQSAVRIMMEGHESSKPEHFDPAVLDAFYTVSSEFEEIFDTHMP